MDVANRRNFLVPEGGHSDPRARVRATTPTSTSCAFIWIRAARARKKTPILLRYGGNALISSSLMNSGGDRFGPIASDRDSSTSLLAQVGIQTFENG